jgi:hypothetical protein
MEQAASLFYEGEYADDGEFGTEWTVSEDHDFFHEHDHDEFHDEL